MVAQVTQLTNENIELKTRVDRKETDLQLLQNEIDQFEALLNKADDELSIKDQPIENLQQQLTPFTLKNGPLTTAVMAVLCDNETTQNKVCTECETKETELHKSLAKAKELQRIVDDNKIQLDFFEERNSEMDECLIKASEEIDRAKKETRNFERLYERAALERNLYERRFNEVLEEQDMLDAKIMRLTKEKHLLVDHYEDEMIKMKGEMKRMLRLRGIQKAHDETIQVGLQHLQSCLQKKLRLLGVFKCHKTASKLDVVNKLLVHADCALNLAF